MLSNREFETVYDIVDDIVIGGGLEDPHAIIFLSENGIMDLKFRLLEELGVGCSFVPPVCNLIKLCDLVEDELILEGFKDEIFE
jgi:hypothetical protein